MTKRSFLILFLSVLGACAGTQQIALSPAGARVELVKADPGPGFQFIADVVGSAKGDVDVATISARNDLRNKAAEMGATLVVLDSMSTQNAMDYTGRNQVVVTGRAYRRAAAE